MPSRRAVIIAAVVVTVFLFSYMAFRPPRVRRQPSVTQTFKDSKYNLAPRVNSEQNRHFEVVDEHNEPNTEVTVIDDEEIVDDLLLQQQQQQQQQKEEEEEEEEQNEEEQIIEADPVEVIDEREQPQILPNRKVVSYALYGGNPKYTSGAIINAKSVHTEFPGWEAQFYVDDTVPASVIDQLKDANATIVTVPSTTRKMFRRFLVADDPTVERFIVRDSDSRLQARDWAAVQDWVKSGKQFHCLRDHLSHSNYPISGGLWGATTGWLPNMQEMIEGWSGHDDYLADMNFLNSEIWPMVKDDKAYCHDAYSCHKYPNSHPFPTVRQGWEHCGQVFDENNVARQGDIDILIRHGKPHSPDCVPPS